MSVISRTIRSLLAALLILSAGPLPAMAQPSAVPFPAPPAAPGPAVPENAAPDTAASGESPAGEPVAAAAAHLPRDLSPWGMFLGADIVVKAVMVGLALASVVTWTVLLAKTLELSRAVRRQRRALAVVGRARSLREAERDVATAGGVGVAMVETASNELRQSADALHDRDGLKERVASHLERIEAAAGRRMTRGTGVLATIGSTAPFVGLFGTVWGIMNSFIGISQAQTTNLAVVAPGIAEALLATAFGLIAAIPAVVIYNHFARRVAAYKALVADTAAAILRLISRDLSRGFHNDAQVVLRDAAE